MPRRSRTSSGGRSAPRPAARPVRNSRQPGRTAPRPAARPVRNSTPVRNSPQPARSAPPPAPARAYSSSGRSRSPDITVGDGFAFGIGYAVACGIVGALLGPPTTKVANKAADVSPASANADVSPVSGNNAGDACGIHNKAFQDCLNNFESEISKCQFYFDKLNECRKNSSSNNA